MQPAPRGRVPCHASDLHLYGVSRVHLLHFSHVFERGAAMKRAFLGALLGSLISLPAWSADPSGAFYIFGAGGNACAAFLGAREEAAPRRTPEGGVQWFSGHGYGVMYGWILGYVSHVNQTVPGKANHFEPMDKFEIAAWVASWCRDNTDKDLFDAVQALINRGKRLPTVVTPPPTASPGGAGQQR